jgi:hypothetical protein
VSKKFETIQSCRLCESTDIKDILNLGNQPPANSLYSFSDGSPPSVPLRLMYCQECSTVQLGESVEPDYLFSKYLWVTGTSAKAGQYSREFSEQALARCAKNRPSVVEIASNDGTFLKRFIESGCEVLGVDPAKNIAELASSHGVPTEAKFFTAELAKLLIKEKGQRDIVFARNVLPHVKEIKSVVGGIQVLLSDDGVGVVEFHDAGLILEELHYDSIYHEHLFLFSLKTISQLLENYNLHVFDIIKSPISGGSWVIYFSKEKRLKTNSVVQVEQHEKETGVNTYERWAKFAEQAKLHSEELRKIILRNNGKMLAYGASARSSTLLNFCKINSDQISAIIDKNPLKQGLITPGSNIPIVSLEQGLKNIKNVDRILLLAWNFKEEIVSDLRSAGFNGQFIVPLPNKPYIT